MTDKKIFYLLEIDKKSQISVLLDLLIRFKINFKELTPEELACIKSALDNNREWGIDQTHTEALLKKLDDLTHH